MRVLQLVRMVCISGDLEHFICFGALVVLIPKDQPGDYQGIALLGTNFKVSSWEIT